MSGRRARPGDDSEFKIALTVNPARAERWFAGSGHTFAELLAIADAGKALPRFALQGALRAKVKVETTQLTSDNVAAKLTGADPALKNEYVVLTAHLDHLGVGGAVNGDRIYNGAMDNASGIATLIETAAAMAKQPARPKRSVLFVAVTAEEKGLLGSRYFATNPTVSAEAIVANINMDMFLPLYPFKILTVFGLDESDLGATARTVASSMGLAVQADPEPARNRFIRSDQVQLHPSGHSGAGAEGRLRARLAAGRHRRRLDEGAVSRAVGRSPAAHRPRSGRRLHHAPGQAGRRRRRSAPASPLERRQLLQALRPAGTPIGAAVTGAMTGAPPNNGA